MQCRTNCGACCIAITISSPLPRMPNGKKAGVICTHLDENKRCKIFGSKNRPQVCSDLKPSQEMCGESFLEAMAYLTYLEQVTAPSNNKMST